MRETMNTDTPLKVLVVDDTVVYRKIVSDILEEIPDVQVVGSAHNGKAAMLKVAALKPDLLILDIEMPEMTGIEVLEQLQATGADVGAIMLSTLTQEGGAVTMQALERGAFDFIPKPQSGTMTDNRSAVKNALIPMLKAYIRQRAVRKLLKRRAGQMAKPALAAKPDRFEQKRPAARIGTAGGPADIISIAISTGGPKALAAMLPALPADIGVPILIVQHMPPMFTRSLAESLDRKCAIKVKEAESGEPIQPGTAYIAPGGRQMKVAAGSDGLARMIKINDDPPENNCRPSADYLFRSVATHYLGRTVAVVMTGMGSDGAAGAGLLKRNGAVVVAQDAASCVVYGMPKAVIDAGIADTVVPLDAIAHKIVKCVKKK